MWKIIGDEDDCSKTFDDAQEEDVKMDAIVSNDFSTNHSSNSGNPNDACHEVPKEEKILPTNHPNTSSVQICSLQNGPLEKEVALDAIPLTQISVQESSLDVSHNLPTVCSDRFPIFNLFEEKTDLCEVDLVKQYLSQSAPALSTENKLDSDTFVSPVTCTVSEKTSAKQSEPCDPLLPISVVHSEANTLTYFKGHFQSSNAAAEEKEVSSRRDEAFVFAEDKVDALADAVKSDLSVIDGENYNLDSKVEGSALGEEESQNDEAEKKKTKKCSIAVQSNESDNSNMSNSDAQNSNLSNSEDAPARRRSSRLRSLEERKEREEQLRAKKEQEEKEKADREKRDREERKEKSKGRDRDGSKEKSRSRDDRSRSREKDRGRDREKGRDRERDSKWKERDRGESRRDRSDRSKTKEKDAGKDCANNDSKFRDKDNKWKSDNAWNDRNNFEENGKKPEYEVRRIKEERVDSYEESSTLVEKENLKMPVRESQFTMLLREMNSVGLSDEDVKPRTDGERGSRIAEDDRAKSEGNNATSSRSVRLRKTRWSEPFTVKEEINLPTANSRDSEMQNNLFGEGNASNAMFSPSRPPSAPAARSDPRKEMEESLLLKPEKVKSRWRRNSELERGEVAMGTPPYPADGGEYRQSPVPLVPIKEESSSSDGVTSNTSSQQSTKDYSNREKPPFYEELEENLYLFERRRSKSKKEVRRMVCDCTLTKEDKELGLPGCGDDCLNRLLMIECGSRCPLGDNCTNKRYQKRQYAKTEPFKTEKKGWGLRVMENLRPGTFVLEYVGEVLSPQEFKQRVKQYARDKIQHYYFMALKSDEIIDATMKGNLSRFINHSCDPNCETQKWTVNGELRIGFFTRRYIRSGEELTFDYQFQRYGKEAQRCYCGSENCRGYIGEDKQISLKSGNGGKSAYKRRKAAEEKKRETVEDLALEEEIEKLSACGGLRNREQTLMLSRLMVRADDTHTRQRLLDIIQNTTENACLRLFLDYHGLSLLWSWMVDIAEEALALKTQILQVLAILPVPNKTMLLDSKVMMIVQRWLCQTQASKEEKGNETSSEKDGDQSSEPPSGAGTPRGGDAADSQEKQGSEVLLPEKKIIVEKDEKRGDAVMLPEKKIKVEDGEKQGDEVMLPAKKIKVEETEKDSATNNDENESKFDSSSTGEKADSVAPSLPKSSTTTDVAEASVGKDGQTIGDAAPNAVPAEQQGATEMANHSGEQEASVSPKAPETKENAVAVKTEEEAKEEGEEDETKKAQEIANLASTLLSGWKDLKEVFRIPRLEQQKRREDEREADRRARERDHANRNRDRDGDRGRSRDRSRDRDRRRDSSRERERGYRSRDYERNRSEYDRNRWSSFSPERREERHSRHEDQEIKPRKTLLPTPPKMSKEERRQLFAMEVQQRDEEEALRRQQEQTLEYFSFPGDNARYLYDQAEYQRFYYHSTSYVQHVDIVQVDMQKMNMQQPVELQQHVPSQIQSMIQATELPIPVVPIGQVPLPPSSEVPEMDGSPSAVKVPRAGQALLPTPSFIPPSPCASTVAPPSVPPPTPSIPPPVASIPPPVASIPPPVASIPPPVSMPTYPDTSQPPPVVFSQGGIVYQHPPPVVATPQQAPYTSSAPPVQACIPAAPLPAPMPIPNPTVPPSPVAAPTPVPPTQTFVSTHTPYVTPQGQPVYYVQSAGPSAVLPMTDQAVTLQQAGHPSLPLVHIASVSTVVEEADSGPPSPPKPKPVKLPPNWKTAKDAEGNIYYYHGITRQTQWDPPTWDQADDDDMDLGTPTYDEPKQSKKRSTTTAAADTSSEVAKKLKELFRTKMSSFIVQCLSPYRKPDCKLGRITSTEDFKHLARKLTHFVMVKELKHCKSVEELECNENVKHKSKDFVHKYMAKYGPIYRKDKDKGNSPRDE